MTLNQLKYAIAVSESDSFNVAARKLYISQPSLSTSIHALEEETGIQIFRRSQNGIAVTPDGKEFLGYARQAMQHYTFAVNAFVEMVKQYGMDEYEFAVHETKTHEVVEDVKNGKSEIGILYLNDFNRKVLEKIFMESMLEFHPLLECNVYVYMSKLHPLAHKDKIALEELKDYPCLSFDQGEYNSFYYAEEVLSTYEYKQLIKANDRATMLNLMVGLNGYTLCSGIICEELNGDNYCAVKLDSDERMEIGYISRKGAVVSAIGQKYLEEISKSRAL